MKLWFVVFVSIVVLILALILFSPLIKVKPNKISDFTDVESCLQKYYFEDNSNSTYKISLISREFSPKENYPKAWECMRQIPKDKSYNLLIQLKDAPSKDVKALLELNGIKLLNYIPKNAWFAEAKGELMLNKVLLSQIRWLGIIRPEDKMQKSLWEGNAGSWGLNGNDVNLVIKLHDNAPSQMFETLVTELGGEVTEHVNTSNSFTIKIPMKNLKMLANENSVRYIDTIAPPAVITN